MLPVMDHLQKLVLSLLLCILISKSSLAAPQALVLPVSKDAATNLLVVKIQGRTPLVSVPYVIDVTANMLWVNCETNYKSSTLKFAKCGSTECNTANTSFCHPPCSKFTIPFCHDNTCGLLYENPITHQSTIGEVAQDVMSISSTDGSKLGTLASVPNFLFTCSPSALVERGLPKGVQGVVGLANHPIAPHNQLGGRLGFKPIFALCFPRVGLDGVMFFGDGPYVLQPDLDVTKVMKYTPLSISGFREYYVSMRSVKINNQKVPVNTSLLVMDDMSSKGVTISTIAPYTILEESIYKAVTTFFTKELTKQFGDVPRAKPVSPFGLCFDKKRIPLGRFGPAVPTLDFEMGGGEVLGLFGDNIMVEAQPGVLCFAFVNGKNLYRPSITLGTYTLQETMVQFDLARMRFGFSPPLNGARTSCGNFNFGASRSSY